MVQDTFDCTLGKRVPSPVLVALEVLRRSSYMKVWGDIGWLYQCKMIHNITVASLPTQLARLV